MKSDAATITYQPAIPSPQHVLVIDDNQIIAKALSRVLDAAGYASSVFHNATDALEFAQTHPVHAALVDIHLPDLNGLVVSSRLRALLGPDVPIIVVSGDTSMANLNALPHVGATYFFSKPVTPTALVQKLQETLRAAKTA